MKMIKRDHEQEEIEITFEPGLQETAEKLVQRKLVVSFILQSTLGLTVMYQDCNYINVLICITH